jgi:CheY-like chemotaxis protein
MSDEPIDIVLVEDNVNDAELTKLALKKSGVKAEVCVLRDGAEAIEYFLSSNHKTPLAHLSAKLVLLDLKLPKLSGFQVLSALREHPEYASLPIVILSSSAVESDIGQAYRLGANSYIVKPIDYAQHAQTIADTARYWISINRTLN